MKENWETDIENIIIYDNGVGFTEDNFKSFNTYASDFKKMLGCKGVLTKAPIYAVERIKAIQKVGFIKSEHLLIGKTGYAYDGYWTF